MSDLKVWALVLMGIAASGGMVAPALAEPPLQPNTGTGHVASNAGVSLDSDSPGAEPDGAADSAPTRLQDDAASDEAGGVSSNRAADDRPVVIPRSTVSGAERADVQKASWSWLKSGVLPLAAVLGVIGAVYWAVRRWVPAARTIDKGVLSVVARAVITPKHTVALLHVGQRFVLVGVSGDRVERLETIEDPREVADLLAATRSTGAGRGPFLEALEDESSSYQEGVEQWAEPTIDPHPGGARATQQLGALLGRLRRLQKKEL
jgi:flagellar biogenesis protein FliO